MKKVISEDKKFQKKQIYINIKNLYKDKKYEAAIKESGKYLDLYGFDENVLFIRAKIYREMENYGQAIVNLKYILNNINKESKYALTELFFLYYHLEKYEEAYELIPTIYKTKCIKPHSLAISELIIKKQLGLSTDYKIGSRNDTIKSQITEYDKEAAINHIKEHLIIDGVQNHNQIYFKEGINLEYLFDVVTESLKNSKKSNEIDMLEVHYFGINNIGSIGTNICNYIKVITVPNTTDIITMYPTVRVNEKYTTPLIYDYDKLYDKPKVKTISQIEKFNKRFNRV